jgi:hypothetical protein
MNDAISSVVQAKQDQVYSQINVAVMRKGLDAVKLQGEASVQLIQAAADIAQALGKGLQFDAQA